MVHVFIHLPTRSGLKLLQARKFIECVQELRVPRLIPYTPSFYSTTEYETANTDFSSDTLSVGSGSMNRLRPIAVQYLFCRDIFVKCIQSRVIPGLVPDQLTLQHLSDRIKGQESIADDKEIELFSHEGYPLNANEYTSKRKQ